MRSALIVATSQYKDTRLPPLEGPAQDAEALRTVLAHKEIGGFDVRLALNYRVDTLRRTLESFFSDRARDDLLLVHFSGHGLKDDDGQLFLAASDTRIDRLLSTGVDAAWVNRLMNKCRSEKIALFLDCCFAGAFTTGMTRRVGVDTAGVKEHFTGRGLFVITASDAMQYSFEGGHQVGQPPVPSPFTKALVDGLHTGEADRNEDGDVSINELFDFLEDRVRETSPSQTPTKSAFNQTGDWVIARSTRVPSIRWLPLALQNQLKSEEVLDRFGALYDLRDLIGGPDKRLAMAARQAVERLALDDSRKVAAAAQRQLDDETTRPRPSGRLARRRSAPLVATVSTEPELAPLAPPVEARAEMTSPVAEPETARELNLAAGSGHADPSPAEAAAERDRPAPIEADRVELQTFVLPAKSPVMEPYEKAEAAERERLRAEVEGAREREREAVAERDRLAVEAETYRAAEKARREREAEAAAREQTNAAEAQRVEYERQRSKEVAEASAAEAARLETQRVWTAAEVDRLKSERRQLEAELRAKRDASAGRVDPAVAQPRPSEGQAKKGASGSNAEAGWSATTMGSARSSGRASTTGRAKTARTWPGPKPGIDASRWMATRRSPNRGAVAVRGFLAGALLVGTLSALYIYNNHLPPPRVDGWGAWFQQTISNLVAPVLGLTLVTIVIATFGGMLIELLVPPLRAPARDASRWVVVLVLGLTLGPISFYVSWTALQVEAKAGRIDPFQVVVVSVLAFLVAELWMARGSKDARPSV